MIEQITKRQAKGIVAKLLEKDSASEDLKELIYFFASPSPKVPQNEYEWVAKFVSKQHIRQCFNYVYVKGKDIVACNGHAMVIIENTKNLKDGYYDYVKKSGHVPNGELILSQFVPYSSLHEFPDYKKVFGEDYKSILYNYNSEIKEYFKQGYYIVEIDGMTLDRELFNLVECCGKYHTAPQTKVVDGISQPSLIMKTQFGYAQIMSILFHDKPNNSKNAK